MSELQLSYVRTLTDLDAMRFTVDQMGYILKTQEDQLSRRNVHRSSGVDEVFIDQVG